MDDDLAPLHGLVHRRGVGDVAESDLDRGRVQLVDPQGGGDTLARPGQHPRRMTPCDQLRDGDPGAHPIVVPDIAVGLAAVTDLADAADRNLGNGATQDFLGGEPSDVPDAYRVAQPDLAAPGTVLVHGDADDIVPVEMSTAFETVAEVIVIDGDDHFSVIDPTSKSWARTLEVLARL